MLRGACGQARSRVVRERRRAGRHHSRPQFDGAASRAALRTTHRVLGTALVFELEKGEARLHRYKRGIYGVRRTAHPLLVHAEPLTDVVDTAETAELIFEVPVRAASEINAGEIVTCASSTRSGVLTTRARRCTDDDACPPSRLLRFGILELHNLPSLSKFPMRTMAATYNNVTTYVCWWQVELNVEVVASSGVCVCVCVAT